MTPRECTTVKQAEAAASGVMEARLIVARLAHHTVAATLDEELYKLQHAFYVRASELEAKRKARKP